MGRKKIEIRPLVDERNRNVTFLKRKAGLMKKAWELSVLCGADVSIVIFSAAGKAYEFSSQELDGEINRYLEYEGLIERRRAEEFAAMAEAGEDDEDDEEEYSGRRASTSKAGANGNGATAGAGAGPGGKPVKSLKGRESYKARMPGLREMGPGSSEPKKRKRTNGSGMARDDKERPSQGFIEGLLTDSEGDDDRSRAGSDLAGLNYAMSMGPGSAPAPSQSLASFPSSLPFQTPSTNYRSTSLHSAHPLIPSSVSPVPLKTDLAPSYASSAYPQPMQMPMSLQMQMQMQSQSSSAPISYPPNMGGMQWNPELLQRYAEFQLQQNHQRQQRLLLERQREQLALMGVEVGGEAERRAMDEIFGMGGGGGGGGGGGDGGERGGSQAQSGYGSEAATGAGGGEADFMWPTFGPTAASGSQRQHRHQQQQPPYPPHGHQPRNGHFAPDASSSSATSDAVPSRQVSYDEYYRHAHLQPQPQVFRRGTFDEDHPTPAGPNAAWFADLKPDINGGAAMYSEPMGHGDGDIQGLRGGAEYADDVRRSSYSRADGAPGGALGV